LSKLSIPVMQSLSMPGGLCGSTRSMEYLFQALRRRLTIKELRHYDAEGTWWPSMSPTRVAAMQHPAMPSGLRRILEYVEFVF